MMMKRRRRIRSRCKRLPETRYEVNLNASTMPRRSLRHYDFGKLICSLDARQILYGYFFELLWLQYRRLCLPGHDQIWKSRTIDDPFDVKMNSSKASSQGLQERVSIRLQLTMISLPDYSSVMKRCYSQPESVIVEPECFPLQTFQYSDDFRLFYSCSCHRLLG